MCPQAYKRLLLVVNYVGEIAFNYILKRTSFYSLFPVVYSVMVNRSFVYFDGYCGSLYPTYSRYNYDITNAFYQSRKLITT